MRRPLAENRRHVGLGQRFLMFFVLHPFWFSEFFSLSPLPRILYLILYTLYFYTFSDTRLFTYVKRKAFSFKFDTLYIYVCVGGGPVAQSV